MFEINDLIVYGRQGVFRIEDRGMIDVPGIDNNKPYYLLKPLFGEGTIFAPVDTNIFMRPIINYKEANMLIDQIPHLNVEIQENTTLRELNDYYKAFFENHKCEDLVQLIKTVYVKKVQADNIGKRIGETDKNYMKVAEDLLFDELAAALEIPKENVKSYIQSRIEQNESNVEL